MGLKSGTRDAGLDDEESAEAEDESPAASTSTDDRDAAASTVDDTDEPTEGEPAATPDQSSGAMQQPNQSDRSQQQFSSTDSASATTSGAESERGSERPSIDAIPYKLRRNKVNEGREQVPYFLREEVIDAESALQDTLESLVGESVYKSDYREAAMVVAQRRPELVAEVLREWGYDLDGS